MVGFFINKSVQYLNKLITKSSFYELNQVDWTQYYLICYVKQIVVLTQQTLLPVPELIALLKVKTHLLVKVCWDKC